MTESNLPEVRPEFQWVAPIEGQEPRPAALPIHRLFFFLLKYWWIPVMMLVIGTGAGVGYVFWEPPTFVSKARMWETVKLHLPEGSFFTEDVQSFLGTQTELLQSRTLRQLTLERLQEGGTNAAIPLGHDGRPLPVNITVTGSAKSSVFMLEAKSSDPTYTQSYLNALMGIYLEYKRNIRKEVSGDTLASITEQVQITERELKDQQDQLMVFQQTNNLAILEQEGAIAGSYLATLQTKLSDLQLEDRLLTVIAANEVATNGAGTNAVASWVQVNPLAETAAMAAPPSPGQTAFRELEALKIKRAQLSQELRPQHPKIVKLDAEIERAEKLLAVFRRQNQEQLAESLKATRLKIDNIRSSITDWERKVLEANSRIAEAQRLKLNVQRVQTQYDRLVLLLQNVGISRNIDQETLAILEPASAAMRSHSKELVVTTLAGIGGLVAGLGIVLLLMVRDDRFATLSEINEQIGEAVLGQVPEVRLLESSAGFPLLEAGDGGHTYVESFRNLRSALLYMQKEEPRPKVVLVTSALPNEGKSTVAANLARSLALGGSRVVLVDGDMRKGILHEFLGLPREPGLTDLLRETTKLNLALQTNSIVNLALIASGRPSANCGDLFLGESFDRLLDQLRQQFDYVLIDSSPIFATDDAPTLAPKVDGTLFVLRSRFSRGRAVREALNLLYQRNARVLGLVFNHVDVSAQSHYYYKYDDYYPPTEESTAESNTAPHANVLS